MYDPDGYGKYVGVFMGFLSWGFGVFFGVISCLSAVNLFIALLKPSLFLSEKDVEMGVKASRSKYFIVFSLVFIFSAILSVYLLHFKAPPESHAASVHMVQSQPLRKHINIPYGKFFEEFNHLAGYSRKFESIKNFQINTAEFEQIPTGKNQENVWILKRGDINFLFSIGTDSSPTPSSKLGVIVVEYQGKSEYGEDGFPISTVTTIGMAIIKAIQFSRDEYVNADNADVVYDLIEKSIKNPEVIRSVEIDGLEVSARYFKPTATESSLVFQVVL